MRAVFALAMGLLAAAPVVALARARLSAALSAGGCVLLVLVGLEAALGGASPTLDLGSWLGFGTAALHVDGLAGIFLALTGITGAAVSLAFLELPADRGLTALAGALLLCVATVIGARGGFLFLVAWEALTVCIYLLGSSDSARAGGLRSGLMAGGLSKIGGGALLAAFALLFAKTHSLSFAVWAHAPLGSATRGVLFLLFLVCFATKVGVVPLQGALPAGYGAARRLGAASLSVALCAGFYGLWRFEFQILGPLPTWCGDLLLVLGALSAILGIVYAITEDNLRRFLGYSTVEHAGIVVVGLGVALVGNAAHLPLLAAAGLLAATLHVCAHNLSKTLALIAIDRVECATGERTLAPLGGLSREMGASAVGLGVATLTLSAIPPLGGFVSEWFTLEALLQAFRMPTLLSQLLCALAAAALALTAGIGLLAFAKYYGFIFLAVGRRARAIVREPSQAPVALVALSVVLLGLGAAAPWEIHAIASGLRGVLGVNAATTTISHPLVLTPVFTGFTVLAPTWLAIVLPSYVLIALAVVLGARRGRARRAPVWVTGSGARLSAVQYRPSAYSNPIRVILRMPLGFSSERSDAHAPKPMLERRVVHVVDRYLYGAATTLALRISERVRATQSGNLGAYLLYMLVALLVALSLVPILR